MKKTTKSYTRSMLDVMCKASKNFKWEQKEFISDEQAAKIIQQQKERETGK